MAERKRRRRRRRRRATTPKEKSLIQKEWFQRLMMVLGVGVANGAHALANGEWSEVNWATFGAAVLLATIREFTKTSQDNKKIVNGNGK